MSSYAGNVDKGPGSWGYKISSCDRFNPSFELVVTQKQFRLYD